MAALLDENVKWHWGDPLAEGACRNRAQALAWLRRPERSGPGELVEMIDAGERVVVVLRPPVGDGEQAPLRAAVASFHDGKVVEIRGYDSPAAALSAVGRVAPLQPLE